MDATNQPQTTTPPASTTPPATTTPPAAPQVTTTPAPAPATVLGTPPEAPPAPLKLKLAEGTDEKTLAPFIELAGKHKLSQEAAQALYDFDVSRQAQMRKAFQESVQAEQKKLVEAVKADPVLKGTKPGEFEANIALANKAVVKFGGSELQKLLDSTGLGDHPVVVRLFYSIGKAMAEDKVSGSSSGTPQDNGDEAFYKALYPNSPGMFK